MLDVNSNLFNVHLFYRVLSFFLACRIWTTVSNRLFHARRELKLIQRTFILACTLICLGIPYLIFVLISFVTEPPKYHFRIAYIFIDFSILIVMILRYYFTQPVKDIIRRVLPPTNIVAPTRAIARTTAWLINLNWENNCCARYVGWKWQIKTLVFARSCLLIKEIDDVQK